MIRRRAGAPRRWAILASGLVALAFVGLAIADAAQLTLSGTGVFVGTQSRCTNGPVAITGGATHTGTRHTSVSLTNLAASCSGKAIQVTVFNGSGILATGTGTAGTSPFDIATSTFTSSAATGVALLVRTWGVPTTWTPPVVTPTACTATPIALAPGARSGASDNYQGVTFSSVDPNCVGLAAVVRLYNSSGGLLATATGTVASGSFTLGTDVKYRRSQVNAATVALVIDGFSIPRTWTP